MSFASPTADYNPLLLNQTQQIIQLQNHNPSSKSIYTSIDVQDRGDISHITLADDQHQLIDLPYACSIEPTAPNPFVLSFIDLSYGVKIRPKMGFSICQNNRDQDHEIGTKLLLDNISGQAREGEILAVLGASGSGKSTLIDALAGQIEKESLEGTVTLNGEVLESRVLKTISAYVMQDDLLFPMLTVEETLMFSADFRLPRSVSKQMKQARVQALIEQLGLQSVAKTVIGDEGHRGVSGGERRRISIGVDIIHDPILLFLDEPTSGLDSTSAFMVIKVLQRIAKSGSIVIMSVHQPSNRIVSLLDHLIFLSRGQTIYNGKFTSLLQFFEEFGHPIPENKNLIEFALDLILEFEESSDRITSLVKFNKSWAQAHETMMNPSKLSQKPIFTLEDVIKASISKGKLVATGYTETNVSNLISSVPTFVHPFWIETIIIAKRQFTNSRRMPQLFVILLFVTLVLGFILAILFRQLDASPKGIVRRLGFSAFAITGVFFICVGEISTFFRDRYIFMREVAYNTYRRSSYVLAHSIVSIPSMIVLSFTFAITTFWSVGLAGGLSGFFFFFFLIFASFWAGISFMAFISGLMSHYLLAVCIGAAISALFLLFSGDFISRDEIPPYWIWFHYISIIKYPFQGILQNEYGDSTKCFVRGLQVFDYTPLADISDSMKIKLLESMSGVLGNSASVTSSTCFINGAKVLELKGETDHISKWTCLWITIAWGFFFRVLFYLTLLFRSNNKRR